jgi:anti-sigma regulatory factor (Ser/Thr protein kinase)
MTTRAEFAGFEWRWAAGLPGDPASVARARSGLRAWLEAREPELASAAALVVSELVANAVEYGRAPVVVVAALDSQRLRLEVCDGGCGQPVLRRPAAGGGWGLTIVDRLAQRWGTASDPVRVWCELAVHDRQAGAATTEHAEPPLEAGAELVATVA